METFEQFEARVGLKFKEYQIDNYSWTKIFWQKIYDEKILKGDLNFVGFRFPSFFDINFHIANSINNRLELSNADFSNAVFMGKTDFSMINFSGLCKFNNALFLKETNFSHVSFHCPTYFNECTFNKGLNITWVEFYEECDFSKSTFSKDHLTTFRPLTDFGMFHDEARFTGIIFPSTFKFLYCNLSKVSFSGSFLSEIKFEGCKFEEKWGRALVYDEERYFQKRGGGISSRHFIHLENIYRNLKQNFEEKLNYHQAGKFYISEMEMRRKKLLFEAYDLSIKSSIYYRSAFDYCGNPIKRFIAHSKMPKFRIWFKSLFERVLIALYRFISNYGQSPGRIIFWFILSFIFGVLFLSLNNYLISKSSIIILKALTFQQDDSSNRNLLLQWTITTSRIISAILLPIFVLSLKRLFKR